MKKIAIEEHFHTEDDIKYLYSRKDWSRREIIVEGGKRIVREWWLPTHYNSAILTKRRFVT